MAGSSILSFPSAMPGPDSAGFVKQRGIKYRGYQDTDGPSVWEMICLAFNIDPADDNAFMDVMSRIPNGEVMAAAIAKAVAEEAAAREAADELLVPIAKFGDQTFVMGDTSTALSLANSFPEKPVEAFGVVHDPDGTQVAANTARYLAALKACAGKYRLVHRRGLTVVVSQLATGSLSGIYWKLDGLLQLAPAQNTSLLDISGWSGFVIEGYGTLDCNKAGQTGGYPSVVGGIVSNVSGTQDSTTAQNSLGQTITIPPMPVAAASPLAVSDGVIRGITIQNVFNWPLSLGYITRVTVENCTLRDSNGSPQFFQSAVDCWFNYNHVFNIDDGGFVFYRGNQRCGAIGNNIHDCNDGIGVYAEYDMLPADAFILIANNVIWYNRDSGIGVTTGLTPPALMQQRVMVVNNLLWDNNRSGRSGGGSVGIVGAQGVLVRGNIIFGDGSTSATNPSYAVFVDGQSAFVVIEGNQIADIGSAAAGGYGIWLAGPNNCGVYNNTGYNTQGSNGVMKALLAGSFGAGCSMDGNRALGNLAASWDQIEKPASMPYEQRRESDGRFAVSLGLAVVSGDLLVEQGCIGISNYYGATAQGTTQATAQAFNQQAIVVTSASANAGVIPDASIPYGAVIYVWNRSGNPITFYPRSGGQIEGLGENVGVTVPNTKVLMVLIQPSTEFSGGQCWTGIMDAATG